MSTPQPPMPGYAPQGAPQPPFPGQPAAPHAQAPMQAQMPPQMPPQMPSQAPPQPQPQPQAQAWPPQAAPTGAGAGTGAATRGAGGARPGFLSAVASEWTKLWSVRSSYWCLGVMVVIVLAFDFLIPLHYAGKDQVLHSEYLDCLTEGVMLGQLAVVPLGALSITSEYGTGMIRTTFVAAPHRARVLLAKALVLFGVLFVLSTVCTTLGMLVAHAELPGNMGEAVPSGSQQLQATVGAGLYMTLLGLFTYAVGALLRHSAGSITLVLGLVFVPFIMGAVLGPVSKFGRGLLEYSLLNGMLSQFGQSMVDSGPSAWSLMGMLAGLTAAVLAAGIVLTEKRDA